MSDRYVREKAAVAVHCLAVSHAGLRARLADAWISALSRLQYEDLSAYDPEVRDAYERVKLPLSRESSEGPRPAAQISAERLSDQEALDVARAIMEFHAGVMPV
jgi:hypothetical protein